MDSQIKTVEFLEKKIFSLFKKNLTPIQIFEEIQGSSSIEDVSRFLYNAGLYKTLLEFSAQRLSKKKPLAWPYILKILTKYKISPNSQMKKLLFHHYLKKKENWTPALFACKEWEDISPEFQQLRYVHLQDMEGKKSSKEEEDLLERLEFAKAQNLIKEEEDIILKLLSLQPLNKKYKTLKKKWDEKKAILTIQEQKKISQRKKTEEVDSLPSFPLEKRNLKKSWHSAIWQTAKKTPHRTKNLSFFLYFGGWPDQALSLLETDVRRLSDYWFYLDWALETRQYTKGLELIHRLFSETPESESFFLPLIYIKSQMLYALGKKSSAIEYLTAISQVQPDYKSVQYLLDKWLKNT